MDNKKVSDFLAWVAIISYAIVALDSIAINYLEALTQIKTIVSANFLLVASIFLRIKK